jgi:type I restriction enzyme R subunit
VAENDKIVSRYMEDAEFQNTAFPLLAQAVFETLSEGRIAV